MAVQAQNEMFLEWIILFLDHLQLGDNSPEREN
jgi:hypothetical protein